MNLWQGFRTLETGQLKDAIESPSASSKRTRHRANSLPLPQQRVSLSLVEATQIRGSFAKLTTNYAKLDEQRNKILSARTRLGYEAQKLRDGYRFLAESKNDYVAKIQQQVRDSLADDSENDDKNSNGSGSLRAAEEAVKDDFSSLQDRAYTVTRLLGEIGNLEFRQAERESRYLNTLRSTLSSVGILSPDILTADPGDVMLTINGTDSSDAQSQSNHPLVQEYYDEEGLANVYRERLGEFEESYLDAVIRRAMRTDRGEPLSTSSSAFEIHYQGTRAQIEEDINTHAEKAMALKKQCDAANLEVQIPRQSISNSGSTPGLDPRLQYASDNQLRLHDPTMFGDSNFVPLIEDSPFGGRITFEAHIPTPPDLERIGAWAEQLPYIGSGETHEDTFGENSETYASDVGNVQHKPEEMSCDISPQSQCQDAALSRTFREENLVSSPKLVVSNEDANFRGESIQRPRNMVIQTDLLSPSRVRLERLSPISPSETAKTGLTLSKSSYSDSDLKSRRSSATSFGVHDSTQPIGQSRRSEIAPGEQAKFSVTIKLPQGFPGLTRSDIRACHYPREM